MDALIGWLSSAKALVPAGLLAGLGIGARVELVKWLKEAAQRRRAQRDARKAAELELVPVLAKFARDCHNRWLSNRYDEPYYRSLPKLEPFSDNMTWTALPRKTAMRIRELPNDIADADNTVQFAEYPGEAYDIASWHFIRIGYDAVRLARSLGHRPSGAYASNLRKQYRRAVLDDAWGVLWSSAIVSRLRRRLRRVHRVRQRSRTASIRALVGDASVPR